MCGEMWERVRAPVRRRRNIAISDACRVGDAHSNLISRRDCRSPPAYLQVNPDIVEVVP